MNWGRVLCALGRHSMTRWKTIRAKPFPSDVTTICSTDNFDAHSKRHCRRAGCRYSETRPLQRRTAATRKAELRMANSADTVTKP